MKSGDPPNPRQSALKAAKDLREDLEAIADSDLPFSYDAKQILRAIDQAEQEGDERE